LLLPSVCTERALDTRNLAYPPCHFLSQLGIFSVIGFKWIWGQGKRGEKENALFFQPSSDIQGSQRDFNSSHPFSPLRHHVCSCSSSLPHLTRPRFLIFSHTNTRKGDSFLLRGPGCKQKKKREGGRERPAFAGSKDAAGLCHCQGLRMMLFHATRAQTHARYKG